MANAPPAVTSAPTVLPTRPTQPPINFAPRTRDVRTPAPPADVKLMVPDAPAQVDKLNAVETAEPKPPAALSATVEAPADWRSYDLFLRPVDVSKPNPKWPISDPFTLYLMACIARFTYTKEGQARDAARDAILSVLGGGYSLTVVIDPAIPWMRYDVWRYPGAAQIIGVQGTTTMTEWLANSPAGFKPVAGIQTDARAYFGIASLAELVIPHLTPHVLPTTGPVVPTIFSGHSLGGAIAQYAAGQINAAWLAADPTRRKGWPCVAQYTFGAPAWLSKGANAFPTGWLDAHCRVSLPGDLVPHVTQMNIASANGVGLGIGLLNVGIDAAFTGTAHFAGKEVSLETLSEAERGRAVQEMIAAFSGNTLATVRNLVREHSMVNYCAGLEYRSTKDRSSPAAKLEALQRADQMMRVADAAE